MSNLWYHCFGDFEDTKPYRIKTSPNGTCLGNRDAPSDCFYFFFRSVPIPKFGNTECWRTDPINQYAVCKTIWKRLGPLFYMWVNIRLDLALHRQLGKQIFKINRIKPFKSSNKLVKCSYLSRNWTGISIESVNHYHVRGKDPAEVCLECAAFRFEYDAIQLN